MITICVDSDCLIDFLRGRNDAVAAIKKHQERLLTTEINVFEVFIGIYAFGNSREIEQATAFFASIPILPFSHGSGQEAARLLTQAGKKGRMTKQNDALIASCIQRHGCTAILTRDAKHFTQLKVRVVGY